MLGRGSTCHHITVDMWLLRLKLNKSTFIYIFWLTLQIDEIPRLLLKHLEYLNVYQELLRLFRQDEEDGITDDAIYTHERQVERIRSKISLLKTKFHLMVRNFMHCHSNIGNYFSTSRSLYEHYVTLWKSVLPFQILGKRIVDLIFESLHIEEWIKPFSS